MNPELEALVARAHGALLSGSPRRIILIHFPKGPAFPAEILYKGEFTERVSTINAALVSRDIPVRTLGEGSSNEFDTIFATELHTPLATENDEINDIAAFWKSRLEARLYEERKEGTAPPSISGGRRKRK